MSLTRQQRHALAVVAAGGAAGRPARHAGNTTSPQALASARWFNVHYRTARGLIDAGLVRDELRPTGDGLYLTAAGHTELNQDGAA